MSGSFFSSAQHCSPPQQQQQQHHHRELRKRPRSTNFESMHNNNSRLPMTMMISGVVDNMESQQQISSAVASNTRSTTATRTRRMLASSIFLVASFSFPHAGQAWSSSIPHSYSTTTTTTDTIFVSRSLLFPKPYETLKPSKQTPFDPHIQQQQQQQKTSSSYSFSSAPPITITMSAAAPSTVAAAAAFGGKLKMSTNLDFKMQQFKQSPAPKMFLSDRFYPTATLAVSPSIERRHTGSGNGSSGRGGTSSTSGGGGNMDNDMDDATMSSFLQKHRQQQQLQKRGVLGFDVFELEAHHRRQSPQVDMESFSDFEDDDDDDDDDMTVSFATGSFSAGSASTTTTTSSTVFSSTTTNSGSSSRHFFPEPSLYTSPFTWTSPTSDSQTSSSLPAWLPWIPTKSQILSLKLTELKEACRQRSLPKNGNKEALQNRLWEWATAQQEQHQARLSGDFLIDCFEDLSEASDVDTSHFSSSSDKITMTNGTFTVAEAAAAQVQSPNSLGEWARTVDLDSLFQKRKDIHKQKLEGRPTPNKQKKQTNPKREADKEYLANLSKTFETPSSPYSSNVQVKKLYAASKKADQMGERKIAMDLLETLLEVAPNDARVYRRLARMHSEEGNLSLARKTLQRGLRRDPDNPWLWHGLGQLEVNHGCAKLQARKYFQRAIEADPAFAHSYHALGTLEHTQGNIARAMKVLKQGIQYCPTNHRLHHALGDLYRGAKLLDDAERSYRRALEHTPSSGVSDCFSFSALAAVAYEKGNPDEARQWLKKSISLNDGRHAQGWLALSQLEEVERDIEMARKVCRLAIAQYERGLIEKQLYYKDKKQLGRWKGNDNDKNDDNRQNAKKETLKKNNNNSNNERSVIGEQQVNDDDGNDGSKQVISAVKTTEALLRSVPRYRPGDKFLKVYRNWARLEERYGSPDTVDEVYKRTLIVYPNEYKVTMDWASYYATIQNHGRARTLFTKACNTALNRHADPYRFYAEYEMSLGDYAQARRILFRGAQAVSQSSDGGLGNRRGLAELFHTWALCEWHLGNLPRAEVLFDHALRLTDSGEQGSKLRAFILYSIARLEFVRSKYHLAQHCIGLCLKESRRTTSSDGNLKAWQLWADIARQMGNAHLEAQCYQQVEKVQQECDDQSTELSRLLSLSSSLSSTTSKGGRRTEGASGLGVGSTDAAMMRRDPWQVNLFGMTNEPAEQFYSFSKFPEFQEEMVYQD